ncbi:Lysosomal acid phosphatase [Pseudolycoriella hygida]|uniref:Lysosomal acid phosphatase n=1 Tax=Pseudolycoriella hygida TaxID=35572 RepID=A0A9Q0MUL7_9DIPT|nr:Lysosomal acid phosphatase [Pseudolycoriella hygida]
MLLCDQVEELNAKSPDQKFALSNTFYNPFEVTVQMSVLPPLENQRLVLKCQQRPQMIEGHFRSRINMVNECLEPGRRNMTISVTVLGVALLTVLMAYLVFGDDNDREGLVTLRLIGVVIRHGNRSPTELYPYDPHINYEWPGGLGSLSDKGSLQMLNLGKNLKVRYYKLIPSNGRYSKDNMYVVSSAAERCIMSAASFVAGFLPPLENRNELPISWQPVPINSIPRDRDHILAQKKPCPRYDEALKKLMNANTTSNEIKAINEKNEALYEHLSKHTGNNITNILDVELLYNTLEIEHEAGLTLPEWTEDVFPDKMLPLAERNLELLTETPFMKKVKGGALLTEIMEHMTKKRSRTLTPDRSIFIYSGHDVTLVNLMRALDIIDQTTKKPDFASALVLELHHSITFKDDFEVKIVYYFNSDDKFPKEISIPECNSPCSLTQFTRVMDKVTLRKYDMICSSV